MNCPVGTPRTTNVIVDPRDRRTIWAGIEVDGVYKSLDGGDNWLKLPELGPDPFHGDIHGMAVSPGSTTSVYCTGPRWHGTPPGGYPNALFLRPASFI